MGIPDIILLILIAAALTGAVVSIVKQHRNGRGCGCGACRGCDRHSVCRSAHDIKH